MASKYDYEDIRARAARGDFVSEEEQNWFNKKLADLHEKAPDPADVPALPEAQAAANAEAVGTGSVAGDVNAVSGQPPAAPSR